MFKIKVSEKLAIVEQSKKISNLVKECITDYTDDLYMVAVSRTPSDTGNLENSGSKRVTGGSNIVGEVSFLATNKGFNYAVKMHDGKYKLGDKSKSKRAMRSKYASRSFSVGSKYLEGTALSCAKGYTKDLNTRLGNLLD
jgi:hypothetical protein